MQDSTLASRELSADPKQVARIHHAYMDEHASDFAACDSDMEYVRLLTGLVEAVHAELPDARIGFEDYGDYLFRVKLDGRELQELLPVWSEVPKPETAKYRTWLNRSRKMFFRDCQQRRRPARAVAPSRMGRGRSGRPASNSRRRGSRRSAVARDDGGDGGPSDEGEPAGRHVARYTSVNGGTR